MTSVFELWMVQKGNLLPNKKNKKTRRKNWVDAHERYQLFDMIHVENE
jgi:hypothetical protein